jgi:hypothetical protein
MTEDMADADKDLIRPEDVETFFQQRINYIQDWTTRTKKLAELCQKQHVEQSQAATQDLFARFKRNILEEDGDDNTESSDEEGNAMTPPTTTDDPASEQNKEENTRLHASHITDYFGSKNNNNRS